MTAIMGAPLLEQHHAPATPTVRLPLPWQSGQVRAAILPLPPQLGQGLPL